MLQSGVMALAAGLLLCTLRVSPLNAADRGANAPTAKTDQLVPKDQRKPAPEFSLISSQGTLLKLADYRGKIVLLDFWATWCGGCKIEIPWYMEFDQKYKPEGLAVIGVSMDEDGWKSVKPFLAQERDPETGGHTAMKYPVVIGNDTLGKAYNLTSMPMTLLIDRQGKIALSHTGMVNKDDFERHIQDLLH
ncbi:MAG: TlpA disulfide reductase family protein [Acidobacteriaceae bacterium]